MSSTSGNIISGRKVSNQSSPRAGQSLTVPYIAQLASSASDSLDLTNAVSNGVIDQIQAVYIDNSGGSSPFVLLVSATNQKVICPSYSQGWFPLLAPYPQQFTFSGPSANTPLFFTNVPMPVGTWSTSSSSGGNTLAEGAVTTSSPTYAAGTNQPLSLDTSGNMRVSLSETTATIGDTTIAAGGVAQNLFAGVAPKNGFWVSNPNASGDLWISDSATATANGEGSVRVAANGGTYETPVNYKPAGVVSIYGGTTGQAVTARSY